MKLLTSKKMNLPKVFFITDREEIKDIPIGIPFLYGDKNSEPYLVRILEYEVIYAQAVSTGYPFNFRLLLKEAGFKQITKFDWQNTTYMDYNTEGAYERSANVTSSNILDNKSFKKYVEDSTVYVDVSKLKDLHIFPTWMANIEDAVSTNIHNFAVFNSNMYNKKLEGMYGGLELTPPNRNLINMDWSSSIPKAVATTTATLAKYMAETFYCDLLITAHSTILVPYEEIHNMDMEDLYNRYNGNQECVQYRKLITEEAKHYKTCIIFGDNHSVCGSWGDQKSISKEDGKKLCNWKIDKLICFHTTSDRLIPGYADWFSPKDIEHTKDWLKYLN